MKIFVFLFKAVPSGKSPELAGIAGAHAAVWVKAESVAEAEPIAIEHLKAKGWEVTEVERAGQETMLEHYAGREEATRSFQAAESKGVASAIAAYLEDGSHAADYSSN